MRRGGGGGEEEERSLALLASLVDFLPLFPTKKPGPRLAQNANAQRLVWIAQKKPTDAIHYSLTTLDYSATTTALLGVVWGVHSVIQAVHPETSVFIFPLILHFRYWHSS